MIDTLLALYLLAIPDTSLYFSIRTPYEGDRIDYLVTSYYRDSLQELYSLSLVLMRQDGKYRPAQEYWLQIPIDNWVFKEYYIDNYKFIYNQIDIRYKYSLFGFGYAYRHGHNAIITAKAKYKKWSLAVESIFDSYPVYIEKTLWRINLGFGNMELVFRSPDYIQFHIQVI